MALDSLRVLQIMILVLGLIIVYYAAEGFRKTRSRSMLFLALGFVLISIGAATAGLFFEFLKFDLTSVAIIQSGAEVIGFFLIIYSIMGTRN